MHLRWGLAGGSLQHAGGDPGVWAEIRRKLSGKNWENCEKFGENMRKPLILYDFMFIVRLSISLWKKKTAAKIGIRQPRCAVEQEKWESNSAYSSHE